jgi:hypothetical protein
MRYSFSHPIGSQRSGPVHSHVMLRLLGVSKLPKTGLPDRKLPGIKREGQNEIPVFIRVWVRPLEGEAPRSPSGRTQKRSSHRVRCECPGCGIELSAGRIFQHVCAGPITSAMLVDEQALRVANARR